MRTLGNGFGNHHRQIRHSRHRRCVDIVEYKSEIPIKCFGAQLFGRVREIKFYLIIDSCRVFRMVVGIVLITMLLNICKKLTGFAIVGLHLGPGKSVVGQFQGKINIIELSGHHCGLAADISKKLSNEYCLGKVLGFKIIPPVKIGGDADLRIFEINSSKGESLSVFISHPSPDLGCLCICIKISKRQNNKKKVFKIPFHGAKLVFRRE